MISTITELAAPCTLKPNCGAHKCGGKLTGASRPLPGEIVCYIVLLK